MNRTKFLALCGALAIVPATAGGALAASSPTGPKVTVQVKGLTKTLLAPTTVHGEKGWITKGRTPKGKCSGKSGAGALDAATHHHWAGKYFSTVTPPGTFVTSILGVKAKNPHFWSIFVNGKTSSLGICAIKLHAGEKLLFKIIK